MPLYQVIVLALVQALTEFLPVSSSAHLALVPWLFGWPDPGIAFDVALHFGTLIAVVVYFWKDLWQVVVSGFRLREATDPELKANPKLMWMIGLGTLPVVLVGLAASDFIETQLRDPYLMAALLIGFGLLLGWADLHGQRWEGRGIGTLTWRDAAVIGVVQALALAPGTSRSGVTMTAALFLGLNRTASARFSFLLSTPAVLGAAIKAAKDLWDAGGLPPDMTLAFAVGISVSATAGGLAIGGLMRFLRRFSLQGFVIYRVLFGILIVALAILFRYQTG